MTGRDIDDRDYFARRAKEERQRAVGCEDNSAAFVHLKMAEEYDRRLGSVIASPAAAPGD